MRFTRREFGAAAAGSLAGLMASGEAEGAPAPSTAVFANACDCHVHIIGPQDKYPMVANRPYTPPPASVAQLKALRTRLGIARNVIVQPSFYGTDNSCMLDALTELGNTARGIAVVAPTISDAELRAMDAKGVRGIRINLESAGIRDPKAASSLFQTMGKRIAPLGWHIQIYTVLPVVAQLIGPIADCPVPVVLDHFAGLTAAEGTGQKGFIGLHDLVRAGKAYVKLSAPYRVSKKPDYSDITPLAQSLIYARRDHMLWATDWPHTQTIPGKKNTEVTPFYRIDNNAVLRLFNSWYPDETTRKMILVDNAAKLYRF
ncbi:MAG: hydrolase [Alphaproteobacteria bacterium]|nr:hydrolase [Alphaproteobacteria bacterium]